jgi:pyroglutamyl-peptidase
LNKIMPTLLLTAFDPFAHYTLNPSWEAVKALPETINNYHIHKLRLPNIFNLAPRLLLEEAERVQPDVILLTGMNSGSTDVEINLAALNIKDAFIEDNMGRRPWNEPILADAPAAYFATIPVHEIVRSLRAQKLPVQLEFASGGYVCNEIFYRAANAYAGTTTKVGFVHVPLLPEMVMDENMALPLEKTTEVLQAIIKEL